MILESPGGDPVGPCPTDQKKRPRSLVSEFARVLSVSEARASPVSPFIKRRATLRTPPPSPVERAVQLKPHSIVTPSISTSGLQLPYVPPAMASNGLDAGVLPSTYVSPLGLADTSTSTMLLDEASPLTDTSPSPSDAPSPTASRVAKALAFSVPLDPFLRHVMNHPQYRFPASTQPLGGDERSSESMSEGRDPCESPTPLVEDVYGVPGVARLRPLAKANTLIADFPTDQRTAVLAAGLAGRFKADSSLSLTDPVLRNLSEGFNSSTLHSGQNPNCRRDGTLNPSATQNGPNWSSAGGPSPPDITLRNGMASLAAMQWEPGYHV